MSNEHYSDTNARIRDEKYSEAKSQILTDIPKDSQSVEIVYTPQAILVACQSILPDSETTEETD